MTIIFDCLGLNDEASSKQPLTTTCPLWFVLFRGLQEDGGEEADASLLC